MNENNEVETQKQETDNIALVAASDIVKARLVGIRLIEETSVTSGTAKTLVTGTGLIFAGAEPTLSDEQIEAGLTMSFSTRVYIRESAKKEVKGSLFLGTLVSRWLAQWRMRFANAAGRAANGSSYSQDVFESWLYHDGEGADNELDFRELPEKALVKMSDDAVAAYRKWAAGDQLDDAPLFPGLPVVLQRAPKSTADEPVFVCAKIDPAVLHATVYLELDETSLCHDIYGITNAGFVSVTNRRLANMRKDFDSYKEKPTFLGKSSKANAGVPSDNAVPGTAALFAKSRLMRGG